VSLTALPRYPVSPIFLKMKKRGLLEKIKRVLCRIPFRGGVPPRGGVPEPLYGVAQRSYTGYWYPVVNVWYAPIMRTSGVNQYRTAEYQESKDRKILAWNEDVLYRFWDKYTEPDANGCETWLGKPNHGYGQFKANGQYFGAHRAAAILRLGAVNYVYQAATLHDAVLYQAGLCIGPMCGVHVKLGSHSENSQAPDFAKLDSERVEEMRASYELGGVTYRELAKEYGVSYQHVSRILNNKAWKAPK
jgi:hypothetical protein